MPKPYDRRPYYGERLDGTTKGPGWFGAIPTKNGIMTELSLSATDSSGREILFPALVPGLDQDDIAYLSEYYIPTEEMYKKAVEFAKKRLKEGKSPFKEWEELETGE